MKTITWETNFNNKLNSKAFIHLDYALTKDLPGNPFPMTVQIQTADSSKEPGTYYLLYFLPLTTDQVNDLLALVSHGLTAAEYCGKILRNRRRNPQDLAIYVYTASRETADFFVDPFENYIVK